MDKIRNMIISHDNGINFEMPIYYKNGTYIAQAPPKLDVNKVVVSRLDKMLNVTHSLLNGSKVVEVPVDEVIYTKSSLNPWHHSTTSSASSVESDSKSIVSVLSKYGFIFLLKLT